MHGWRRGKFSDYGIRIREKQRLKRFYGVLERQFRRYFEMASKGRGNTGEKLLTLLERRLDNVIYRTGFAQSRAQARQLIAHGHVLVNGKKHSASSTLICMDDVILPGNKEKSAGTIRSSVDVTQGRILPSWVEFDAEKLQIKIIGLPTSEEVKEVLPIREQLIVEISSR